MNVQIIAVDTDYTEEMPVGYVQIESIEQLAAQTDASIEVVSDTEYLLTCEWGNGEGEDSYIVELA